MKLILGASSSSGSIIEDICKYKHKEYSNIVTNCMDFSLLKEADIRKKIYSDHINLFRIFLQHILYI